MPCEHYQDALTHAAASGVLPPELREHLPNCASCRDTWVAEQNLFASIDMGLSAAANAELPPAFLSRVQACIKEERRASEKYIWMPAWAFAAVSAAILAAISFSLMKSRTPQQIASPATSFSAAGTLADPATPQNIKNSAAEATPEYKIPHSSAAVVHRVVRKENDLPGSMTTASLHDPEVIVPPGEAQAFARFVATVGQNKGLYAAALSPTVRNDGPLQVDEIQIAAVHVEPLNPETVPTDFFGRTHEAQ